MGATVRVKPDGPHSLRWYRLNAGLTANELAASGFVSKETLCRIERGEASVRLDSARGIAEALGVRLDAIDWESPADDVGGGRANLAELRHAAGLTPQEVARAASVPYRTVGRAEAGHPVAPRYAKRLADFYGVRVTDFYPAEPRTAAA